ncbi:hypothetical protein [Nonomuraea salmonea]|uniref:hypothetical protein n=1 Tax=Nonomuraea salmonea TaxID=46181 RepID=UPI002FE99831
MIFRATDPTSPYALIDFDLARPTTRLFDIVTTLRHWAPISDPVDRTPLLRTVDVGARLRLFCDAYGLPPRDRRRLLELARLRFSPLVHGHAHPRLLRWQLGQDVGERGG